MSITNEIRKKVLAASVYDKKQAKKNGQVFTPFKLIEEMCDALPKKIWFDPTKTFFDPTAGVGNMPAILVKRLMNGLKSWMPDEKERYRHIMEKQIFMAELQPENAMMIDSIFNPDGNLFLNLYVGDVLTMPKDFFSTPYPLRYLKYPQHMIKSKNLVVLDIPQEIRNQIAH